MVVLVVEIDNFDLGLIDAERQSPVFGDEQAPRSFAVASQLMCFPARHGPEFILLLHVLEEGDQAAQLVRDRGLNPLASSFSMRRRNPLWTTFLILMGQE